MSFSTKIVFPAPPPTTNTLTPQQRMQLIRSTKKLGRILGTTPQILDRALSLPPMHIHLPFKGAERRSMDSQSSYNSSEPLYRTTSSASSYKSSRSSKKQPTEPSDSWPKRQPPVLRLAVAPSSLETIPASPLTPPSGCYTPARSHFPSPVDHYSDGQPFTIRPPPVACPMLPDISPGTPSFTLPSLNTERRRKMERLRRKLGDDVPLDLVFPSDSSEEDSDVLDISPSSSPSSSAPSSPSSSPGSSPSRKSKPKLGRIQNARDSMACLSPHRAPRTALIVPKTSRSTPPPPTPVSVSVSVTTHTVQERDTRYNISPDGAASHGRVSQSQGKRSIRGREVLAAIKESPNEHPAGRAQEFGIRGRDGGIYEDDWSAESERDDELQVQVQMWSTRRGYGGWPRK